jgi:uncharacterized phage protein gp47/JayE
MSWQTPTLATLIDRIKGDMNARMGNLTAFVRYSVLWVLSYVLAGVAWGLYLAMDYAAKQTIPDTAEGSILERWARIFGIYRAIPTFATGTVSFTGTAGATLADGAVAQWVDAGVDFEVVGTYTWTVTGAKNVTVRAVDAGADGNYTFNTGASIELVSPPAGVASTGLLVTPGIAGGTDRETDVSLLSRLLQRLRNPPHGGSRADYVTWVGETTGLSTDLVWVHGLPEGIALPGIDVYFTVEDTAGDGTVIPTAPQIALVQAKFATVKPMTALPVAKAPSARTVTVAITAGLASGVLAADAVTALRVAIQAAMRAKADVDFSHAAWSITNNTLRVAVDGVVEVVSPEITDVNGAGATAAVSMTANQYPVITDVDITLTVTP